MSKIVFNNKKDKITITNKLSYPETVNERVYTAIVSGMFEDFLPVSIKKKRKEGPSTPSGTLSHDNKVDKKSKEAKKAAVEYDPFADFDAGADDNPDSEKTKKKTNKGSSVRYCWFCGAKKVVDASYCFRCGEKLSIEQVYIDEMLERGENIDFGTMVRRDDGRGTSALGYDEPEESLFPVLKRERTDETFTIDKPTYRIGTEQKYSDLFISDNGFISRSHADIITKNERYYIVDKNSTNKTYVDGRIIPTEKEVEIFSGTKIRLANEEFIFLTD